MACATSGWRYGVRHVLQICIIVISVAEYEAIPTQVCRLPILIVKFSLSAGAASLSRVNKKPPLTVYLQIDRVTQLINTDTLANLYVQMAKRERQDTPDWQQEVPYKPYAQNDKDFQLKYRSSCLCGTVEYAVDCDPCAAKFCHCVGCQRLHGTLRTAHCLVKN